MSNSRRQAGRYDPDEREPDEPGEAPFEGDSTYSQSSSASQSQTDYQGAPNSTSYAPGINEERSGDSNSSDGIRADNTGTSQSAAEDCVIIGPTGAGKTTLLAAMHRACRMTENDHLELDFSTTSIETADLIKLAIGNIIGVRKGYEASTGVKFYPFHIGVSEKKDSLWSMPSFTDLNFEMTDGGGGFIFAPADSPDHHRFRPQIIRRIQRASVLVLCVNITAPDLESLYTEIERMLAETRVQTEDRVKNPRLARIFQRIKTGRPVPEYTVRPKPLLNVDRVLILLTQVDKLIRFFPNPLEKAQSRKRFCHNSSARCRRLCSRLALFHNDVPVVN